MVCVNYFVIEQNKLYWFTYCPFPWVCMFSFLIQGSKRDTGLSGRSARLRRLPNAWMISYACLGNLSLPLDDILQHWVGAWTLNRPWIWVHPSILSSALADRSCHVSPHHLPLRLCKVEELATPNQVLSENLFVMGMRQLGAAEDYPTRVQFLASLRDSPYQDLSEEGLQVYRPSDPGFP